MPYHFGEVNRYTLKTAGRVVELNKTVNFTGEFKRGCSQRGKVTSWSGRSRARLIKAVEAVDWSKYTPLVWVGLTYPGFAIGDAYNARKAKRDLRTLFMRWARKWGNPVGAWKLEFQRRGVPHFHLLLHASTVDMQDMRQWLKVAWWEIVGSGDAKHRLAGVSCDWWDGSKRPVYFAGYTSKGSKEYQNRLPDGEVPGRWWGLWGLKPEWTYQSLSRRQFFRLRRYLMALRRSRTKGSRVKVTGKKYRVKPPRGTNGTWAYGDMDVNGLVALSRQ